MEITEVRIKLMDDADDRLRGFCSITFDRCFVIRDLKIIEGNNGPFVAMPSRKLTAHCPKCRTKNHLRARYCNQCGLQLDPDRQVAGTDGRVRLYADIAHPIHAACREMIQTRVLEEFEAERERARQPGYVSRYDEAYGDETREAVAGESFVPETTPLAERSPPAPSDATTPTAETVAGVDAEVEPRRFETGSAVPQGPHTPPESTTPALPVDDDEDQFGAGIFDDMG